MATADGTVTESTRKGGNGKYVKIRHNGTYSTQYLHMRKQKVKQRRIRKTRRCYWLGWHDGQYRWAPRVLSFLEKWSSGRPFKEKLPAAEPLPENVEARLF